MSAIVQPHAITADTAVLTALIVELCEELGGRYDRDAAEPSDREQIRVTADDEFRACSRRAFNHAVVVRVCLDDLERFGRRRSLGDRANGFDRSGDALGRPAKLCQEYALNLSDDRVGNPDAIIAPSVAISRRRIGLPPKAKAEM